MSLPRGCDEGKAYFDCNSLSGCVLHLCAVCETCVCMCMCMYRVFFVIPDTCPLAGLYLGLTI